MSDLKETITENIKHFRSKRNVSQEKLSQMCGYSSTYIGKIERGQRSPSLDTLIRIAEALQVPIGSFFDPFYREQDQLKADWDPSEFTPYDATLRRFNYLVGEVTRSGTVESVRHLPGFRDGPVVRDAVGENLTDVPFLNLSGDLTEAIRSALEDTGDDERTHFSLTVTGSDLLGETVDFVILPPDGDENGVLRFELFYPRIVRDGQPVPLDELTFDRAD